jgi:hypothetical protein
MVQALCIGRFVPHSRSRLAAVFGRRDTRGGGGRTAQMMTSLAVALIVGEAVMIVGFVLLLIAECQARMAFVRSLEVPKAEQTSLLDDLHLPQDVLGCR